MRAALLLLCSLCLLLAATTAQAWELEDSGAGYTVSGRQGGMIALDMNGDGTKEIVYVPGPSIDGVGITISNPTTTGSLLRVAGGDLDGDGDNDIVAGLDQHNSNEKNGIEVYLNNGDGSSFTKSTIACVPAGLADALGSRVHTLKVVDMNDDGVLDILYYYYRWDAAADQSKPNALAYIVGNGDGTFGAIETILTEGMCGNGYCTMTAFEFVDMNGDGLTDMFFRGYINGYLPGLVGGGYGGRTGLGVQIKSNQADVADVNGDGFIDLVGSHHSTLVCLNDGTGNFGCKSLGEKVGNGHVELADITGDGVVDMAMYKFDGNIAKVYIYEGPLDAGGVAPLELYNAGAGYTRNGVSMIDDLNGDGVMDLVFGVIRWWDTQTDLYVYQGVPEIVLGTTASGAQLKCTKDGCEEFDAAAGRWVTSDSTSSDITGEGVIMTDEFQPFGSNGDEAKSLADGTLIIKSADGTTTWYKPTCVN